MCTVLCSILMYIVLKSPETNSLRFQLETVTKTYQNAVGEREFILKNRPGVPSRHLVIGINMYLYSMWSFLQVCVQTWHFVLATLHTKTEKSIVHNFLFLFADLCFFYCHSVQYLVHSNQFWYHLYWMSYNLNKIIFLKRLWCCILWSFTSPVTRSSQRHPNCTWRFLLQVDYPMDMMVLFGCLFPKTYRATAHTVKVCVFLPLICPSLICPFFFKGEENKKTITRVVVFTLLGTKCYYIIVCFPPDLYNIC